MSYRRRFNLDEVLREWAAEQVASSRDQREPRRAGEDPTPPGAPEAGPGEDEVRPLGGRSWVSVTALSPKKLL